MVQLSRMNKASEVAFWDIVIRRPLACEDGCEFDISARQWPLDEQLDSAKFAQNRKVAT